MNKEKKGDIRQFWQIGVLVLAFFLMAGFSIRAINNIRSAARVIHYTGFVGGATQIVVKEELYGKQNDSLIKLLDEMIPMLRTGSAAYKVTILDDHIYQEYMEKIKNEWEKIKEEIYKYRAGGSSKLLYEYSENTYEDTNLASFAAQAYMESYAKRIKIVMIIVYITFFFLFGLYLYAIIKNNKLKTRANNLNQIAYYDPYIGIANKTYCEKKLKDYQINSYKGSLAVIMFDLNNLKTVNDTYGHQAGDVMIRNFALILDTIAREYGFVGRFGGDEFIAIFEDCEEEQVKLFIKKLVILLQKENRRSKNPWEKISCAAGYAVGFNGESDIQSLLKEADERMYVVKKKMKEKANQE